MPLSKAKGYRVERKIRAMFEKSGWKVVRAGGSLGDVDLICIKNGKCILLQIKSTQKNRLYYYGYMKNQFEKFPFYLVVDFGYGKIRILPPQKIIEKDDGLALDKFIKNIK